MLLTIVSPCPIPQYKYLFLLIHGRNHLHISFQHLGRTGIISLMLIKGRYPCHLLIRQRKIKQCKIITDMVRVLRAGNHNIACLYMPAQNHLRICLLVFRSQFRKYRFVDQCFITMSEPVMSPVWTFLFLRERMSGAAVMGCAIVIVTLIVSNSLRAKRTAAP